MPGEAVYVKGTFEDQNYIKLKEVLDNNVIKKEAVLSLFPGVYHYYFVVDGKDCIDNTCPSAIFKNKLHNVLTVESKRKLSESPLKKLNSFQEHNSNDAIQPIQQDPEEYPEISFKNRKSTSSLERPEENAKQMSNKDNYLLKITSVNSLNKLKETKQDNIIMSEKSNLSLKNSSLHKNLQKLKKNVAIPVNNSISMNLNQSKNFSNMNYLDISANFSINVEGNAVGYVETHELNDFQNLSEENIKIHTFEKGNLIIVYKLAGDFLIPMQIVGEDEINNTFKLKYLIYDQNQKNSNYEINVRKESIFYQNLVEKCLNGMECLTSMDEFNELSVLKNIIIRINNKFNYSILNDIFIFFINKSNEDDIERIINNFTFEFLDWFNLNINEEFSTVNDNQTCLNQSNLIFIKNKNFKNDFKKESKLFKFSQFEIFWEILRSKNHNLLFNHKELFSKLILFSQLFKMNTFLIFSFSEKLKNYVNFQFCNLFPSQTIKNELKNEILISSKNVNLGSFDNSTIHTINNKIHNLLEGLDFDNLINHNFSKFFTNLSEEMLKFKNKDKQPNRQNIYLTLSEIIIEILLEINMTPLFQNIFVLLILSFILSNFKNIFNKNKILKNNPSYFILEDVSKFTNLNIEKSENLNFYSNLILMFIFKFVFDLVSSKLNDQSIPKSKLIRNLKDLNKKGSQLNLDKRYNLGLIISDPDFSSEDDLNLLNDLLFNKVGTNSDSSNKSIISKFLQFNFDENISNLLKNLNNNQSDLNIITYFEKVIDFRYFYDFYKSSYNSNNNGNLKYMKILDLVQNSYKLSLNEIENIESSKPLIKQIWTFQFDSLDTFFTLEENVIDFLQNNKIIEYAKFFKNKKKYYVEFKTKSFFQKFLPILEDIDKQYEPHKDYSTSIDSFFKDLQKFEDIHETFEVDAKKIKLNYQTYSIIMRLLKNVIEEKTIIIQKNFKRKVINNFINYFRKQVIVLQNKWRSYFFKKFPDNFDYKIYSDHILNKSKKHDPITFKIYRKTFSKILQLENDNIKCQEDLKQFKKDNIFLIKENTNLKLHIDDLQKKITQLHLDNISIQGSTPSMKSIHTPINKSNLSEVSNAGKRTVYNESFIDVEMRKALESKLFNYKNKYKDLVQVISDHEKKMEKLVKIINSKQEIKDVLSKYGIKIN